MSTKVGLDEWNAPEMLKREVYNEKIDLWGVGCILYFMISGEKPFLEESLPKLYQKITNSLINFDCFIWQKVSDDCKAFIKALLDPNPNMRLSAE
jgi:serine/threonine protein kinase